MLYRAYIGCASCGLPQELPVHWQLRAWSHVLKPSSSPCLQVVDTCDLLRKCDEFMAVHDPKGPST